MKKSNIKLYSITGFLLLATLFSGIILSSTTAKADDSTADSVSISINTACTITTGGGEYSETIDPNTSKTIVGNGINVSCNDSGGYALYAIGFSGDSYDAPNNNRMLGPNSQYIPTANSGSDSYWAMKAAGSSTTSNVPTIDNSYSDFQIIPATYTKISHYSSVTVGTTDNSVTTPTYKVNVSAAQPVGTYVGKVKYTIVHPSTAPAPSTKLYMQDATLADCGQTMYDSRDSGTETAYTTALIGSQCWMTTNLNLAGGTALSADDTDVTSAYISSFTTSNNLTKTGDTIALPPSTTDSGFDANNYSYVANSGNASSDCSSAPGCYSYYSWDAATLGSGRTIATDNTDAEQSICPKGWHLPNTRTGTNDTSDFRKLMIALGGSSSKENYDNGTTPTGATMSTTLQASPNSFLLAGYHDYGSFGSGGSSGFYWSSTSYSSTSIARYLYFNSKYVYSAYLINRYRGFSVRCVLGSS